MIDKSKLKELALAVNDALTSDAEAQAYDELRAEVTASTILELLAELEAKEADAWTADVSGLIRYGTRMMEVGNGYVRWDGMEEKVDGVYVLFDAVCDLLASRASGVADTERLNWLEANCIGAGNTERGFPFLVCWSNKGARLRIRAQIDLARTVEQSKPAGSAREDENTQPESVGVEVERAKCEAWHGGIYRGQQADIALAAWLAACAQSDVGRDAARYRWVRRADYAKLDAIKDKRWKGLDKAVDAEIDARIIESNRPAEADVEVERKLYLSNFPAFLPGYWTERQEHDFKVWLAARTQADAGKDTEAIAEIWDDAKAEAAMYVEAHCVDGEFHANAILSQPRPTIRPTTKPENT